PRRGPPRLGGDRAGARVCQRARRAAGRAAQRPERADRGAGGTEGRGGAGSADRTSHRAACSRRGKRGKRLSERCNREGDRRDGGAGVSGCARPARRTGCAPRARAPVGRAARADRGWLYCAVSMHPPRTAVGTWSGGPFMHFGEPLADERLLALLRPGGGIGTVMSADAYGAGEADTLLGRAIEGVDRNSFCLIGAIGHDFYEGEREGAKGFPRFTDPRLRSESKYGDYIRMAAERSLERLGAERFDLLLLHNPDRTGYTNERVWEGMRALREDGLTRLLGVAPGPANGFTLDLIDCIERFGALIDWAMVILSPMEPWPGELVLDAAAANEVKLITRVVDYGGLFHDDVRPGHPFAEYDHRKFRPAGWVEAGMEKLERMRPYAERHGLTLLQLACQWNLAHSAVECVAPTLIQEGGS